MILVLCQEDDVCGYSSDLVEEGLEEEKNAANTSGETTSTLHMMNRWSGGGGGGCGGGCDKYNSDDSDNDVDGDDEDDDDDDDDDGVNDNVDSELQEPGGFPGESGQAEEHHTGLDKEPHTDAWSYNL